MDRFTRLLQGRRSRIAAVVGAGAVVLAVGAATATILTPDPIAAPVATSPTADVSPSASVALTSRPSVPPATPEPTTTPPPTPAPPPHTVSAGVIQAVSADVRVRQSADLDAPIVATLSMGQQARTTATTVQAGGYTWTDIELQPSGIRGWGAIADRSGTDPWLASVQDGPIVVTTGSHEALVSTAIGLGGHVDLVDPDSGSREPITVGADVTDLAGAPDGERAVVVVLGQWIQIVSLHESTSLETVPGEVTITHPVVRDPRFSPDGLAVAYRAGDAWTLLEPRVEVLGPAAAPRLASVGNIGPPVWSIDGNELWTDVTDSAEANYDVAALGLDGSVRQVTNAPHYDGRPAPAPDGTSIVYFSNDERGELSVTAAHPDGRGPRIIYTPEFRGGGIFAPLRWEPAGSRVAMRFDYTEDAEDEAPSRVEVIDVVTGGHATFDGPGVDCGELTWSPTGTRLAMVCRSEPGSERHLFVIGIDGSDVVDLGPAIEMDWAPDLRR